MLLCTYKRGSWCQLDDLANPHDLTPVSHLINTESLLEVSGLRFPFLNSWALASTCQECLCRLEMMDKGVFQGLPGQRHWSLLETIPNNGYEWTAVNDSDCWDGLQSRKSWLSLFEYFMGVYQTRCPSPPIRESLTCIRAGRIRILSRFLLGRFNAVYRKL